MVLSLFWETNHARLDNSNVHNNTPTSCQVKLAIVYFVLHNILVGAFRFHYSYYHNGVESAATVYFSSNHDHTWYGVYGVSNEHKWQNLWFPSESMQSCRPILPEV